MRLPECTGHALRAPVDHILTRFQLAQAKVLETLAAAFGNVAADLAEHVRAEDELLSALFTPGESRA